MKTHDFIFTRCLSGVFTLAAFVGLHASPLTWFPGPPLDEGVSGAATVLNRGANLVIGGDSFSVRQLSATNSYWTWFLPFYGSAYAPGAVSSGGLVIVYGGNDGTASTSAVIGYSTTDNSSALASMSVPRSFLGYAPDRDGNAYAIGGLDVHGQALASVERYNMDANSWAAIAAMPTARYDFPAVFDRTNRIFIFGGRTNAASGTEISSVLRYSVTGNSWSTMAAMPIAVAASAATWGPDGKIYVVGGVSSGITTNLVQVYNPAANSWTVSTPLPEGLSLATIGMDTLGRLVVMGGAGEDGNDVGDVWRSQQLTAPDIAPTFTSYPAVSATYQVPYVSSINATGNPQPTFLLRDGPAGMTVDPYTGAINWTPQADQIGTNSVTIRATNYPGFADWNFAITVPNPPPIAPTNLTVVSVTDNSVTLSWAPEDPVVGPTTYRVYLRHVLHDPRGSGATIWYTQIGDAVTSPTITITGLAPGTSQSYYVTASAPGGTSGYSGVAATTTAPQGPPALFVTEITSISVSLAWSPSPGPAQNPNYSPITSYTIMERNTSVYPAVNVPTVTNITGTNGTVTGLTPGRSHIWFVAGVDAAGNASAQVYPYFVITNPVPTSPILTNPALLPNGSFQFTVLEGSSLQIVKVQATTTPGDPNSWTQIDSVLPTSNPFTFTDSTASQYPARFYRLLAP